MQRRGFIVGGVCVLGVGASGVVRAIGADAAVLLVPGARAQLLRYFTPAAGPLERHAARPGAWYALLYLPMAPQWPMQLVLWPARSRHEIRLFALDAAPGDAPSVVHPLPLELESDRNGRAGATVSRFMLPANSTAPAVYVLVEQWHINGEAPPPLWLQWFAQRATRRVESPWWSSRDRNARDGRDGRATAEPPPPSPLTQQLRGAKAHEVPIYNLPGVPDWSRW